MEGGQAAGGGWPWEGRPAYRREGPRPPDRGVGFAFPSKTNAGAVELEKCCFVFEVSEPSTTGSDSIFGTQVLEGHPLRRASRSLSLLSPDWSLGGDLGSEVPPRCCC